MASIVRSLARAASPCTTLSRTAPSALFATALRPQSALPRPRHVQPATFPITPPSIRTMATADNLVELLTARRSYYALTKDLPISTDRVQELVKKLLHQVPTSFNSQTNRAVVLLGAEHDKFWDITSDTLKAIVPAEKWESTATRLGLFKGAAGTVLVFEDQDAVKVLQEKFALYADRFPGWAGQSAGMLELAIWTALEAEGLGANLQHYNPLVDEKVAETWKLPASWKLNAQVVFGGRGSSEVQPKDFNAIEDIYKVFGA